MLGLQKQGQQLALEDRLRRNTVRVGIVGLGYVGLPLAVEFAKAGFHVTGIDIQDSKVASASSQALETVIPASSTRVAEMVSYSRTPSA